jgi:hypothetical protein
MKHIAAGLDDGGPAHQSHMTEDESFKTLFRTGGNETKVGMARCAVPATFSGGTLRA